MARRVPLGGVNWTERLIRPLVFLALALLGTVTLFVRYKGARQTALSATERTVNHGAHHLDLTLSQLNTGFDLAADILRARRGAANTTELFATLGKSVPQPHNLRLLDAQGRPTTMLTLPDADWETLRLLPLDLESLTDGPSAQTERLAIQRRLVAEDGRALGTLAADFNVGKVLAGPGLDPLTLHSPWDWMLLRPDGQTIRPLSEALDSAVTAALTVSDARTHEKTIEVVANGQSMIVIAHPMVAVPITLIALTPRRALDFRALSEIREDALATLTVLSLILILLYTYDRSQRERAALNRLIEAERARLDNILSATAAGTWEWDLRSDVTHVNARWAEMLGYSPTDIEPVLGKGLQRFCHPEDLPHVKAQLKAHLDGKLATYEAEYRLLHRDGHWIWVADRGRQGARRRDGTLHLMFGALLDISSSKRQQAELLAERHRLKLSLEASGNRFWEFDAAERCISVEGEYANGLAATELATVGQSLADIVATHIREADRGKLLTALRARRPVNRMFVELALPDGTAGYVSLNATVLLSEDGNFQGWRIVATDISAQVDQQIRLAELRAALATKNRLMASISHDLRQPLQAMLLYLGTARQLTAEPSVLEILSKAEMLASTVMHQMSTLVDLGRSDAEMIAPQSGPVELHDLMARLVDRYRVFAAPQRTELRAVLPPCSVQTDSTLLERIVGNILHNAVKFAPKGRVLVGLRRRADHVLIEVFDTGPGIPAAIHASIFNAWENREKLPKQGQEGTGVGLSVVRQLAERLDIEITLASVPGQGSHFRLTVPKGRYRPPRPPPSVRGKNMVIVDDDPAIRSGLETLLSLKGHRVLAFPSGEAVLSASDLAEGVDIALIDLALGGGIGGADLILALRGRPSFAHTRFFVLTGERLDKARQMTAETGVSDILLKPISPPDLIRRLQL